MKLENSLYQEQAQQLSVFQLQSLQLLALSNKDLQDTLQKEYTENPFMDYTPSSSGKEAVKDALQFTAAPDENIVKNFILDQLNPEIYSHGEWALLTYLAENVDEYGFLDIKGLTTRLALPSNLLAKCVKHLQSLNPPGICTVSVQECLKEQLRRKKKLTHVLQFIIDNHLADIGKNNIKHIAATTNLSRDQVLPLIRIIRSLRPHPLEGFSAKSANFIIPDVVIQKDNAEIQIFLNDTWMGSYSISDYYIGLMKSAQDPEVKAYFQRKYYRCYMMLRNLEQRRNTLLLLSQAVWEWQFDFFVKQQPLKPMTLHDIASKTKVHSSTVCRAIKDKYLQTPVGTIAFKQLFQRGIKRDTVCISQSDIKKRLAHIISQENPSSPLSDAELAGKLSEECRLSLSRRVISKYRESLHIANSYNRKL
ncbi:MAG: RNA polymerase factor sigma-54 [Megasphaera sp.]|jgi:RNA polymerase sigma-54 factor|uniref:RNA polymerase factor sigma-54 n=1 Tax=Megasphaera sueciensis TaxID=349094 RepID=UPI003D024925|nr:RNA polymerase factor sigma-54 [Megasphaera sp.]MCI1823914.1 RNA polymerase factor sigma-54 [Megasphaera sp.]